MNNRHHHHQRQNICNVFVVIRMRSSSRSGGNRLYWIARLVGVRNISRQVIWFQRGSSSLGRAAAVGSGTRSCDLLWRHWHPVVACGVPCRRDCVESAQRHFDRKRQSARQPQQGQRRATTSTTCDYVRLQRRLRPLLHLLFHDWRFVNLRTPCLCHRSKTTGPHYSTFSDIYFLQNMDHILSCKLCQITLLINSFIRTLD